MTRLSRWLNQRLVAVIVTSAVALPAVGEEASLTETAGDGLHQPLQLRTIMQDLGREMQRVTGAIALEDWPKVAEAALRIADHPRPPVAERLSIIGFIGSKAGVFKEYDQQVHEAARSLSEAARRQDGTAVIQAFAQTQINCLGCHQSFRQPILDHFYPAPAR